MPGMKNPGMKNLVDENGEDEVSRSSSINAKDCQFIRREVHN